MTDNLKQKNQRVALITVAIVCAMIGLSFASVPLYDLFCRVTGYGGTTQVSNTLPDQILDREMVVRFDSRVDRDLGWQFKPEANKVAVKLGQGFLISYRAENTSEKDTYGTAIFNVVPDKAGLYLHKVNCFCFDAQKLDAGEAQDFPVYFYIDPALHDDPDLQDLHSITLSYTFYPSADDDVKEAAAKYNKRQAELAAARGESYTPKQLPDISAPQPTN